MANDMKVVTQNQNATHWSLEDGYNNTDGNYGETYPCE